MSQMEKEMSPASYQNFDLLFDHTPDGYQARVIASPAGEETDHFTLPFSPSELENSLALVGGDIRLVKLIRRDDANASLLLDPQTFGTHLYTALFGTTRLGVCLRRSIDLAQGQGAGLRIRLRLADVPELAMLPWEYLFDPDNNRFFAHSTQTPLVRYLPLPQPVQSLHAERPLRILAMIATPQDMARLNVEQEWHRVQEALSLLQASGAVTVTRLPAATLAALQSALRQGEYHVFHFIGHGWFDATQGQGTGEQPNAATPPTQAGLLLEDEQGNGDWVTTDKLGVLLHDHPTLRLAFLNACEGARAGSAQAFSGVAQTLVQQSIHAVIAMQFAISDAAAIALAQEFYRALAGGYPVDAALAEGRKALYTQGRIMEWGTPVLFSRSADNQLFDLPSSPVPTLLPFEPETIFIPAGPFIMGSAPGAGIPDHETPPHEVTLPAYRIAKYPVTNRQYLEFVRQTGAAVAPATGWQLARRGQEPPPGQEEHPVVGLTWDEATAYCCWLSEQSGRRYRLPSEAEWEKAARGTDGRRYPWGEYFDAVRANTAESGSNGTTPVGAYSPQGDSVYGCAGMAGNVWEWTNTIWGRERAMADYTYPYRVDQRENAQSLAPYRELRICRGGSYREPAARATCSARTRQLAVSRNNRLGLRVALKVD